MMTTGNNNTSPTSTAKINTIMEAASALTALGDNEDDSNTSNNSFNGVEHHAAATTLAEDTSSAKTDDSSTNKHTKKKQTRYLPNHKKPDAALTFPEKMMKMMQYSEAQGDADFCVTWLPDGKSFVIRNCKEFTNNVVPLFFKATKFASFTRKLYRWGFRQVNRGIGPDDPIIFGNEHFLRDHPEDMANMKSVTAASARKAETGGIGGEFGIGGGDNLSTMMMHPQLIFGNNSMKRSFEHVMEHDEGVAHNMNKRALYDRMFEQQQQQQQQGHKVSATMGSDNSSQYQHHHQQQQQMQMQQPTSLYGVAAQSMPHNMTMNGQYQHQNYHQQQQQQQLQQELLYQQPNKVASYEIMLNNHHHSNSNNINNQGNSLFNPLMPQQHHQGNQLHHHHHHNNNNNNHHHMYSSSPPSSSPQYPSVNSTAEIVNAAIAALRYA